MVMPPHRHRHKPSGCTNESPAEDTPADTSLGDTTERCLADFNTAIDSGDADQALRAVLELEEAITAWSADTLQSDDADRARATLRSMITRLGDAAIKGLDDPTLVRLHWWRRCSKFVPLREAKSDLTCPTSSRST